MEVFDQIKKMYENYEKEEREAKLKAIYEVLDPLVGKLNDAKEMKALLEADLKEKNIYIAELEVQIRQAWGPHIQGADTASIELPSGLSLQLSTEDKFSVEDKDLCIKWLEEHNYRDVMKWDIHTQTLYRIARDELASGNNIEGLNHYKFKKLKTKKI